MHISCCTCFTPSILPACHWGCILPHRFIIHTVFSGMVEIWIFLSSPLRSLICSNTCPALQRESKRPSFSSNTWLMSCFWAETSQGPSRSPSCQQSWCCFTLLRPYERTKKGWNFRLWWKSKGGGVCLCIPNETWYLFLLAFFVMALSVVLSDCDEVVMLVVVFYMHPTQPHLMVFSTSSLKDVPSLHSKVYFLRFILWLAQQEPVSQAPLHSTHDTMRVVWQMAYPRWTW